MRKGPSKIGVEGDDLKGRVLDKSRWGQHKWKRVLGLVAVFVLCIIRSLAGMAPVVLGIQIPLKQGLALARRCC